MPLLQGGDGLLASRRAKAERRSAEVAAEEISTVLQQLGWARSAYARECREQLEAERRRDAIEVPGLSAEALAAIKNLENAAAWTPQQARGPNQVAIVAAAWAAVTGSQPVQEELSRFRELASARLGAGRTDYEPPDFQRVRRLVGIVVEAERVHE